MIDYNKSFIKNNLIVILAHIIVYAKRIILIPLLIKNIGVAPYGGYILVNSGIGFLFGISSLGVGFKFKRFGPSAKEAIKRKELFYPQFFFQLLSISIISIILLIFGEFIKTNFFKNEIVFSMHLVCFVLATTFLFSQSADFFRYTHRIGVFSVAIIIYPYLGILFIALAIYLFGSPRINSLLLAEIFAFILVGAPLLIKICKEIGFQILIFRIKEIIEDIRLGFPLILSYIVEFILAASDRYVIAFFMSPLAVGYYTPAYALGSLLILIPRAMNVALSPLLSSALDEKKHNKVKMLTHYSIKFFLIVAIPFVVGGYVLSRDILTIFANREVSNAAFLCMPIVGSGILFYGLNIILSNILFVQLKTKIIFAVNIFSAILNLMLNIILIYLFRNIVVAAITTLVSYFVAFVMLNRRTRKYLKVKYDFLVIFKCILSSVVMGIVLYCMRLFLGADVRGIILFFLSGITVYFVFLFLLKTFSNKELAYARIYISGLVKR